MLHTQASLGVARVTLQADEPNAAPAMSRVFVRIFSRAGPAGIGRLSLTTYPCPVEFTAQAECPICRRLKPLRFSAWSGGPFCCTWLCREHVGLTPGRQCPRCPMTLASYIGGSMTCEAWHRLSRKRAEALLRREGGNDFSFLARWQRAMSPVCCPSYGPETSHIRLPIPEDMATCDNFSLLKCTNPHARDDLISVVPDSHTYYVRGSAIPLSVRYRPHPFFCQSVPRRRCN